MPRAHGTERNKTSPNDLRRSGERSKSKTTSTNKQRGQMAPRWINGLIFVLLCVSSINESAADNSLRADPKSRHTERVCSTSVIYENDQLLTDRNYTFGILGTKTCSSGGETTKEKQGWNVLNNLNTAWLMELQKYVATSATEYLGNSILAGFSLYTPNTLDIEAPTKANGRPYASLIMFGDSIVQVDDGNTKAIKQGMQLGVLGLSVGERIQTAVHRVIDSPEPKGWGSEISRGGEPTLLYSIQGTSLRYDREMSAFGIGQKLELTTNRSLTVGYYSSLQAGMSIRLGKVHSPFWSDYGPIHNYITRPAVMPDARIEWQPNSKRVEAFDEPSKKAEKRTRAKETYGFLGVGVDLVMYNALLQGQFRRNDYEIEASDVTRLIPHVTAGVVFDFKKWQFSISHNFRAPEIRKGKDHRWTSLSAKCFY